MRVVWGLLLLQGVLWPCRLIGPVDGAPLDRPIEVVLIALLLPALWYLRPAFLASRYAQGLIVALFAWKIAAAVVLTQSGWCGMFVTQYPPPNEAFRLDRSWDARTLWTPSPPSCSAIVARSYPTLNDYPAWIINMPFGASRGLGERLPSLPTESPRPPGGNFALWLDGFLYPRDAGVLTFDSGQDVVLSGAIDGQPMVVPPGGTWRQQLDGGPHHVNLRLSLTGDHWQWLPTWNGVDLFRAVATSVAPLPPFEQRLAPWARWIAPLLVGALVVGWSVSALVHLQPGPPLMAWTAGSALTLALVGAFAGPMTMRAAVLLLMGGVFVPVAASRRDQRGAFMLFGISWLSLFAGRSFADVGRFTIYTFGDDWLTFQRFAHRIYIQGYWLEGGQQTFWNQPLYRWLAGAFHVVFGDSSVGELYLDAVGVLVGSLFAFSIVAREAGFRVAVAAGVLTLATVSLGPNWYVVGRGLSEISAAMWLYLSVMALMRVSRDGLTAAFAAGAYGVLAFLTRMNHLLMLAAAPLFLVAGSPQADLLWSPRELWRRMPKPAMAAYFAVVAAGIAALSARTWYYTGLLDPFTGTQRDHLATGFGQTSLLQLSTWTHALSSVAMIATVQDPPRLDVRAVAVLGGVCCALLAVVRAPGFRRLPLAPVVFCASALLGGLVARGTAYPGRFSIHLIPVAVALSVSAAAMTVSPRNLVSH